MGGSKMTVKDVARICRRLGGECSEKCPFYEPDEEPEFCCAFSASVYGWDEKKIEELEARALGKQGTREAFVFHADFIEDLPERFRADFALYAAEYGLYGKEPPIEDEFSLEMTVWKKIARVIDAEREKQEA